MNDQGRPSSDTRNSGSKVNLRPIVKLMMVAGFPSVNIGTIEIPLLVTIAVVANWIGLEVESAGASARQFKLKHKRDKKQIFLNDIKEVG